MKKKIKSWLIMNFPIWFSRTNAFFIIVTPLNGRAYGIKL